MKKILISQRAPQAGSPYAALAAREDLQLEFVPFFSIVPLSLREFRAQKVQMADYSAVVFSSKSAVDAFFALAEEQRIKIPETLKYFCTTEFVAKYLQKYIIYRKRKIFFADGSVAGVMAEIGTKHSKERFLVACSGSVENEMTRAFAASQMDWTPAVFVKPVSQDIRSIRLGDYNAIVLYNTADVVSLRENFPDFTPGDTEIITFGRSIVKAVEAEGWHIAVSAPTPEIPSAAKAIEAYLNLSR